MNSQKQLLEDNCGQTCVALIAGISQWDALHAVGNDHGTQPQYLQEALFKFGFDVERRRFKASKWPPKLAIALIRGRSNSNYGHAVVVKDGRVLDPALDEPMLPEEYRDWLGETGRHIASLIVVKGKRF